MNALTLLAVFLPVPVAAAPAAATGPAPSAGAVSQAVTVPVAHEFVRIPSGTHVPFYGDGAGEQVTAFDMGRYPVTQHDYVEFLTTHVEWQRDRVKSVFVDEGYLRDWSAPLQPNDPAAPVTGVSWFAARAYCTSIGGRLPTTAEWEYVASANADAHDASQDPAFRALALELYTRPRPARLPAAGSGMRNRYGIHDQHGFVREWVLDFNNVMISDDSRGTGGSDRQLYCAAAASKARDPSDYAAFLRYSFRASLNARSAHTNLGFRCARSVQ